MDFKWNRANATYSRPLCYVWYMWYEEICRHEILTGPGLCEETRQYLWFVGFYHSFVCPIHFRPGCPTGPLVWEICSINVEWLLSIGVWAVRWCASALTSADVLYRKKSWFSRQQSQWLWNRWHVESTAGREWILFSENKLLVHRNHPIKDYLYRWSQPTTQWSSPPITPQTACVRFCLLSLHPPIIPITCIFLQTWLRGLA